MQTYLYWLLGAKKGTQENGEVARMTGIMRSWESIGSAVAYGVGATNVSNQNQMIVAFALWVGTIPFTLAVVFVGRWSLTDEDEDGEVSGGELSGSDEEVTVVDEGIKDKSSG